MPAKATMLVTLMLFFLPAVGHRANGEDKKGEEPKPPLTLEVEIERGKEVSRLRAYIRNRTDRVISFLTGSRGGGGSLNDGHSRKGFGRSRSLMLQPPRKSDVHATKKGTP